MTKKPRERSPATACNVISLGSLRGWLTLMRRDTRWRKLEAPPSSLPSRTKERLIIASLNNDNAFSLIIYIYTSPLYSRATFNRGRSLYGLIPILFHPRNKPAFDSIRRAKRRFPSSS